MKRHGFTLAEVLITLGVIGVVAAITLPILVQNYKKHVWVNQLKSTISIIENGLKKAIADDGVENITDTSLWASATSAPCNGTMGNLNNCKEFYDNLSKYYKYEIKQYSSGHQYKPLKGGNPGSGFNTYLDITLTNGASIIFNQLGNTATPVSNVGNSGYGYGHIFIDVNGIKGPDTAGRDLFFFGVDMNGHLVPYGGKEMPKLACNNDDNCYNYYYSVNNWKDHTIFGCETNRFGYYCAARIIENGWKMDY